MMQQIQLSPVKFNEEEIIQQQEELNSKIALLINTVAIDEITVLFFYPEGESEIQPEIQFCSIIKKAVPPIKAKQIEAIERLTFCYYSMLVQSKLENLSSIQMCFQRYLEHTTYFSTFVDFHESVRKWCKQLFNKKDLTKSKQLLLAISSKLKELNQKRLQVLSWKISVCLILFEIIFDKIKIQRNEIIKLLKSFKNLKKQNKISTKPILDAYKFMIKYFISAKNDLYIFFQREIKIWCQQIVDNSLISEMKNIIMECQQMTSQNLKSTTTNLTQQKPAIQRKFNHSRAARKIVMNTISPHLFYQSNPNLISGRRLIRNRPSKEKEDNFKKKIDYFLKTRANVAHSKSQEATPRVTARSHLKVSIKMSQKPSISLHSISRFTLDQAYIYKNNLKANTEDKKSQVTFKQVSRVSLSASKSANSFYKKSGTRKRKQIYQKIVENEGSKKLITNIHLKDELFLISEVQQQRCKITLQEILIGEFKKIQADPNVKFIGISEDNQFGDLNLTFFTIFNQQLAQISFTMKKISKQGYVLTCLTKSTYCNHPTIFQIEKKENTLQKFTFDDLNEGIVNSVIYYQALQEKVERKIGVSELQAMQELLRQSLGIQLSQTQLTKLLVTVDLLESCFFWYYTKGNYINGCRLERRINNQFRNLSAFAVSLGKFKSDYDSCLNEIVLVQNIKSLVETCVYLSYGRKIVHKAIRNIKDVFYLEVISISDEVYSSFNRKDKKPYFKNTQLQRTLLKVDEFTCGFIRVSQDMSFYRIDLKSYRKHIDLQQYFEQQDVFIFFMKNIVQNFIQIKYMHKIQKILVDINEKENFQVFNQKQFKLFEKHTIEIITNSEQLGELKEFKPLIHTQIKHLKQILFKYCEVYQLNLSFIIVKRTQHIVKIQKKSYIFNEVQLSNSLKIVKIYKRGKRQNYYLFMYHQRPSSFMFLNTSFNNRFVMVNSINLIGNLIRRQKAQMYLSDDCLSVSKNIIKFENSYCYVSVSQCQSIICWRFDYYFPQYQTQYSTFLDEQIYLECLGQWNQNQLMWKQTIKKIKINLKQNCIVLHDKQVKLFKSIKRLIFDEEQAKGTIQLIELSGQLLFLITNFESGALSIGKVQNIMFLSNKSIISPCKERIRMYDNIMNHLYYKILTGKLPSEVITADYFIKDDDN